MKNVSLHPCPSCGEGSGSGGLSSARGGGEKEEEQKELGGHHRNRKTIRGMEIMSSLEVKQDALSKSWLNFQFVLILAWACKSGIKEGVSSSLPFPKAAAEAAATARE